MLFRSVFTTGQVAKICKVAPRTVSKWFDSGRLKGYRIPGSQDRRIPREYLIKFLKEHGMPLGDLEDEAMAKVLIVAQDQVLIENLRRELPPARGFKVGTAASGFERGIQAADGTERLAYADAADSAGRGGVQRERRACQMATGCDPARWFGHVEHHCLKSRAPLYGNRSSCDINRHHVADVLHKRAPKYRSLL